MKLQVALIFMCILLIGCGPEFTQPNKFTPQPPDLGPPLSDPVIITEGAALLISPSPSSSLDRFTLTLTDVPENTEKVKFSMLPSGLTEEFGIAPNLGIDRDASDGYGVTVIKENFDEGLYDIIVIAVGENDISLEVITTQITITHSELDISSFPIP